MKNEAKNSETVTIMTISQTAKQRTRRISSKISKDGSIRTATKRIAELTTSQLSAVGRTRGANSAKRLKFFPKSSAKDLLQRPVWITATSCMTLRQKSKI